jgi:hypothetical protein
MSNTVLKWIAVIALLLGVWSIYRRYQIHDWAVKSQHWQQHIWDCHARDTHASPDEQARCNDGPSHVSPPPPPPFWL